MSKKETILEILEKTNGFVSGEFLSQECGISRTAVWKHIQKLQQEGYEIESQHGMGYKLIKIADVMTVAEIGRHLPKDFFAGQGIIYCYDTLDSTNQEARRLILKGCGHGTVITAEKQTAGRGRLGREWDSSEGKGIWFSIILEPGVALQETSKYSFVIAVAVAEGISQATGLPARIKWPNDILINGKKVCGILLELVAELMQVHQLIVGVGINANQKMQDFPENIQKKATSLAIEVGDTIQRSYVLGTILKCIEANCQLMEQCGFEAIREKWLAWSCILNKEVQILQQGKSPFIGVVTGIDYDGTLLVQTIEGVEHIVAGDVSLRAADGSYFA